ncbi:MAG: hypothetical protein AAGA60_17020 [Cyanobacteria bacterium P01_E01_bin.42]
MTESKNRPQSDDAILGNSKGDRGGMVLGGIEGVKQRLSSPVESDRIEALSDAIQYGEEGLKLVMKAFLEDTPPVRKKAYTILRDRDESEAKSILQSPQTWQYCQKLWTWGHPTPHDVYETVISANGRILASSYINGTRQYGIDPRIDGQWIEMWNLKTHQFVRILKDFERPVKLAISSDGQTLISGECSKHWFVNYIPEYRETIKVWDISTGQEVFSGRAGFVLSMTLGMDDRTLAVTHYTSDRRPFSDCKKYTYTVRITIWDIQKKKELNTIEVHHSPPHLNKYTDGSYEESCPVDIYPASNIVIVYQNNCFFDEAKQEYTKGIKAWDFSYKEARELYSLPISDTISLRQLAIAPNGLYFATAVHPYKKPLPETSNDRTRNYSTIKLWNLQPVRQNFNFNWLFELFKKESAESAEHSQVYLQEKYCLGLLEGHQGHGESLVFAFSPDGKILASASRYNKKDGIKIWDVESKKEIYTLPQSTPRFMKFHQDKKILYVVTWSQIQAWGFE